MAAMNDPIAAPAKDVPKSRYVPGSGQTHRHVLVVLVNNQPGVLNRVSSMVRSRNFNIESLAVGHTERPDISRMTITLRGDDFAVEQMSKQLYRLIDVLKVQDLPESGVVEHELALIKVRRQRELQSSFLDHLCHAGKRANLGRDFRRARRLDRRYETDAGDDAFRIGHVFQE